MVAVHKCQVYFDAQCTCVQCMMEGGGGGGGGGIIALKLKDNV